MPMPCTTLINWKKRKRILEMFFPKWLIALFLFASGLLAGLAINNISTPKGEIPAEKRQGQYEFINPLLECEGSEELISTELKSFKNKLAGVVNQELQSKKVAKVAVYFRDLIDGPWFGIDEDGRFLPGSLLKVPVMMGFFKKAESNPGILKKTVKYEKKLFPYSQSFEPVKTLEIGKSYTIEELIYRMIVYSDNEALSLLLLQDNDDIENRVYRDLNIKPFDDTKPYYINIITYTTFFRVLFNASYLNKEMSNKALKMLASSNFTKGLVAGVPVNIPVAHKFGEFISGGQKQFHDCGIIYHPQSPYMLCIMGRGDDVDDIASVIQHISASVFEEVNTQLSKKNRQTR